MSLKYESHVCIEFDNSVETPDKKSAEWIEFFEIFHDDLIVILDPEIMVLFEELHEIWKLQFLAVLAWLAEFLVYFFYYFVRDHMD